jgi:hypothetical protein
MNSSEYKRFEKLSFADFRRMAKDESLSQYEKIGFPDSYREGKERLIFEDIKSKLGALDNSNQTVLDIGPGCSELPLMLIELCQRNGHSLILVDSEEMLARLPDERFIRKVAGYYPQCATLFAEYRERVDVILAYSVLHYVFAESNVWDFLDQSLSLLAHGGAMLLGDIPNVSQRKRFFSTPAGVQFHQHFMQTEKLPEVEYNQIERGQIDDAVVLGLVSRARQQGFDAYLLPQRADLPMANRREDIMIKRP